MAEPRYSREQVRRLAMIMGAAIQRALFRTANLVIAGSALLALLFLPAALVSPVLLAAIFLASCNTFLGATDENELERLLSEFSEEGRDLIPASDQRMALPSGAGRDGSDAGAGELRGKGRELYRRMLTTRKELDHQLSRMTDNLPALDLQRAGQVLDSLQERFRALAVRMGRLERMLSERSAEKLEKEAEKLEERARDASSEGARRDFLRAADEKRRQIASLAEIRSGVEGIEAKLAGILSSLESYLARMTSLDLRGDVMNGSTTGGDDVENLVQGLTDEAEDLERMMDVISQ